MVGRIVLVRHGPSSYTPRGLHDRDGVDQCRAAYDIAGILPESQPPLQLQRVATTATHVVSSDLVRAIESCRRLAGERGAITSPLLREIPLDIPRVRARLPLMAWEALIHLKWAYEIVRGRDLAPSQRAQAREAAAWLISLSTRDSVVVAVTHGAIRRAISGQLRALEWTRQHVDGGYRPWSAWTFERAATSR